MSGMNRKTGRVKFFNSTKGYGFIIPDDQAGRPDIEEYDLVQGAKGMQAANVSGPGGAPVLGDPNASLRQYQNGGRATGGGGSNGGGGGRPYGAFMDPYGPPAFGYPGLPYVLPPGFQYGQQQYPVYRYSTMSQQAPPLTSPEQQQQPQSSQQQPATSPMLFAGYPPGMGYNQVPAYPQQKTGSPQQSNGSGQNQ
ncbi:hypothetical protein DFQ30_002070 [Apophysomyces sp. BC1015]|nr:hypothetical protein DFQ30_002070 [Apophysomyces sp. BC1015]KAG0179888.1 hypothetical protein DFQ29_001504 [Apophysomyces sp. BC1021]